MTRSSARASQSDLSGALARVRERFRGQRVAGVLLVSDGADTGPPGTAERTRDPAGAWPVFAIGVGATDGLRDREVLGIAAGDQRLDHASVDLQVSAASSGFGRAPFQLRVLADGRLLESRRVVPAADGSPIEQRFTVFPDPQRATVYTAEIPTDEREPVAENNTRSVLVSPAGRKRRLLVIEGAPGFEHTFMRRAWAADIGLEVDSVVRKGKNANGSDTFLVQADAARTAALTNGFPGAPRGSVRLRRARDRQRRRRFLHPRAADDDRRLRGRTRRRAARDGRPIVRAARPGGDAGRSRAAGGARRAARRT